MPEMVMANGICHIQQHGHIPHQVKHQVTTSHLSPTHLDMQPIQ